MSYQEELISFDETIMSPPPLFTSPVSIQGENAQEDFTSFDDSSHWELISYDEPRETSGSTSSGRNEDGSKLSSTSGSDENKPSSVLRGRTSRATCCPGSKIEDKTHGPDKADREARHHPQPHDHQTVDDRLLGRMLRGETIAGHKFGLANEISQCFDVGADGPEKELLDRDAERQRSNVANLVLGIANLYPKRRPEGWGLEDVEKGTSSRQRREGE